ncbi:Arginase/deacetylase, partial [Linderina pennispora]
LSAGALLALCEQVALGRLSYGVAIIRPPGHHACQDKPMGFCLFNNVSVAVHDLLARRLAEKIVVVDWDVHHGNGIQEAFYNKEDVLYISLHRYDGEEFYPVSDEGRMEKVGSGGGEGFNINIPWPCEGVGDGDYLDAFRRVVIPVVREFGPDMVIVSAGFDAAVCDPIGLCKVTPQCYAVMTSMLRLASKDKLVLALEGGYNL